jgi:hypothetical protein
MTLGQMLYKIIFLLLLLPLGACMQALELCVAIAGIT